jgi:drug/metabolite transporter (DMT)-like permease
MTAGRSGTIALALVSALMWGLWWAPVRWLEGLGLEGFWATLAMCAGTLPTLWWFARGAPRLAAQAAGGAVLIGVAVMLYGAALAFTDVVRAVLLFYLAPAWSTAIECLFMGRRWERRSGLALALSFFGVAAIFRFEISSAGWGMGDVAALASGLGWSIGAALIFAAPGAKDGRAFAALGLFSGCGGVAATCLALVVGGAAAGAPPGWDAFGAAPLALATGAMYLAPILLMTMFAALRLAPATMSFLLTAEIVSGVASSALFLDEPFGAVEAVGALLVAAGALVETVAPAGPAARAAK